jgi:cell division protein FtsB
VQSWIAQQALVVAAQPYPDIPALRVSIRQRFNDSLSAPDRKGAGAVLNSPDSTLTDALVFLVLMQAAQDTESDLQSQMQQMQTINQQKQALRQIVNDLHKETGAAPPNLRMKPCTTPVCRSLPSRLSAVNQATAELPKPTHFQANSTLTAQQLDAVAKDAQQSLDSMSEMGEMTSMRLQMAMDRRSKFMETLSNIEKSIDDTQSSIIGNLK